VGYSWRSRNRGETRKDTDQELPHNYELDGECLARGKESRAEVRHGLKNHKPYAGLKRIVKIFIKILSYSFRTKFINNRVFFSVCFA